MIVVQIALGILLFIGIISIIAKFGDWWNLHFGGWD